MSEAFFLKELLCCIVRPSSVFPSFSFLKYLFFSHSVVFVRVCRTVGGMGEGKKKILVPNKEGEIHHNFYTVSLT